MALVHFRTDEKRKRQAQLILHKLGLDLSTAFNMYLVRIIEKKGIPFEVVMERRLSPKEEKKIQKEIEWARKYGKRYNSAKEMFDDILRE